MYLLVPHQPSLHTPCQSSLISIRPFLPMPSLVPRRPTLPMPILSFLILRWQSPPTLILSFLIPSHPLLWTVATSPLLCCPITELQPCTPVADLQSCCPVAGLLPCSPVSGNMFCTPEAGLLLSTLALPWPTARLSVAELPPRGDKTLSPASRRNPSCPRTSGRIWKARINVWGHLVDWWRMATKGPGEMGMWLERKDRIRDRIRLWQPHSISFGNLNPPACHRH